MSSPIFKSVEAQAEALAAYDAAMTLWPVPFEHRDVATEFGSTHVIVCGDEGAPPLVLLHCALMTSAIWSPLIAALAVRNRIYAVDVIGDFGRSVPRKPPTSDAAFAAWLGQTLDALAIVQTNLLGWSFGGFVAANFTRHQPQRVLKLGLLAPFATFVRPGPGFFAGVIPMLFPTRGTCRWFERRLCYRGSFGVAEHSEILYQRFRNGRVVFRTGPRVFTDKEFGTFTMPTLLLVGEEEFLFSGRKAVQRAQRVLPNGEAELIPHCNHAVVSDQTERVTNRLLVFFNDG